MHTPSSPLPPLFSICIGRQLGAGGRAIGKRLASHFDATFYDKRLLIDAARTSGFCQEIFEAHDEKRGFFAQLMRNLHTMEFTTDFYGTGVDDTSLFRIQSETILNAAATARCVFMGRAADYVLREQKNVCSVFIAADEADRMARIMEIENCNAEKALRIIEKADKARAEFYNFYTSKRWGRAASYDLCVNVSRLGIEESAKFIADFVKRNFQTHAHSPLPPSKV